MALSAAFKELKECVFEYRSERKRTTEAYTNELLDHVIVLVKDIALIANRTKNATIDALVHSQMGDLYRIYDTLVNESMLYIDKTDKTDKTKHSEIKAFTIHMLHTFRIQSVKVFEGLPTKLLTQFCKGITYFDGEVINERPFYQRDASCGSKTLNADIKFSIPNNASPLTRQKITAAINKCYMERQIYNKLYMDVLHHQDPQHLLELRTMERFFQDEIKQTQIEVLLVYTDQIYPIKVQINTIIGTDEVDLIEEHYKKVAWNDLRVKCTKLVIKNKRTIAVYHKVQTFSHEEPWLPGSHPKTTASSSDVSGPTSSALKMLFNGGKKQSIKKKLNSALVSSKTRQGSV